MLRGHRLPTYLTAAVGIAILSLLLLQALVGRVLQRAQIRQLGSEVASNLTLGSVALERFGPEGLAEISGMRLAVGPRPDPEPAPGARRAGGRYLRSQALLLEKELCQQLVPCPPVLPAATGPRGVWVRMGSPLEVVWMFVPLPSSLVWPPDPLLLSLSLGMGGLGAVLLFLTLEVQRPLRQLEGALSAVDLEARPAALDVGGAGAVRQLTARFNAMVERLERSSRERSTMLAGIAHDLRSPLTRLRLRLGLAGQGPMAPEERGRAEADITALERITGQFLVFAGAVDAEPAIEVPLDALLAEAAAFTDELTMDLPPLQRRVRPAALSRAVANLLDNALSHGRPPLRLVLRAVGAEGFEIQVWDGGDGIAAEHWDQALRPFQRLDLARGGGRGHSGLGLAIADRVARDHGGELRRLVNDSAGSQGDGGLRFGLALRGRSLPPS